MTQWVTAKVNTDVLEKDKDYKVIRYVTDGWDGEYKIQLPEGDTLIVSDEFFYKDEENEIELIDGSFEDLTYIEPKNYSYITTKTLSNDQKVFLSSVLVWYDNDKATTDHVWMIHYTENDKKWTGYLYDQVDEWDTQIFFNDIFVEK